MTVSGRAGDVSAPSKFAYADPPYYGLGSYYADRHPEALQWDDLETHHQLIDRLSAEYPDGWALSLHSPALKDILPLCPRDVRVLAWVKPFASFKPGVGLAYTWEPVIFRGGRRIVWPTQTVRDHIAENITLKKGLVGAKPEAFCEWILRALNVQAGDTVDDLFPGTSVMGRVVERYLTERWAEAL